MFERDRFNDESPSVDLDADKTNTGQLKELVEEVKSNIPKRKKVPKVAEITPDKEVEVPEELIPDIETMRQERTISKE